MREIETLYPIKKNNIKRNLIIILIAILLLVGIFISFKNNKLDSNMDNEQNKNEEKLVSPPKGEDEETSEVPPNYVNYICEKEGNYGTLNNIINYKNNYRYEFFFDWDENAVTIGKYNVDYIFNNLNDYNNALELPITFKDKFYEEKYDEDNLTKTLMFYYKLEYPNISLNDLNSYLKALANDKFSCKVVENEKK